MNEQSRFESEVRAYLHAQVSGDAPPDLLARGMSGVRHTPQRRSWISRLSGSWILPSVGGAAVVAAALLVAVMIGLLPPTPTPVGPSPSSSPTTSASGSPVATPSATATPVVVPALPGFNTNAPTSPDATWTALTWGKLAADDPLAQLRKVIRWSGGYIALGQDQAAGDTSWTPVWTSSDGVSWTSLDPSIFGSGTIIYDVAQLPSGGLVALTGAGWANGETTVPAQSWTSNDGRNWTAHPGPRVIAQAGLQSNDRPLLASGPAGVIASSYWRPTTAAISTDGVIWTALPETALPTGFAMGALVGTADGYVAVGATPVDADHDQGAALWSSDGLHWTQGPKLVSRSGIVLASSGETWGFIGLWTARSGFIAQGRVFAAPGAEMWWQSGDGHTWQKLTGYPPLGATTGEGEGVGAYPSGYMASDGQRMLAEGTATWVSADGLHWSKLAISGDLPASDANQITLLPGGILRVQPGLDGTSTWYGEAAAR
jgi:hypothetical protein